MMFRKEFYFLSNFYPVSIETKNWGIWLSAEHLYHACKYKDKDERQKIKEHPAKGLKAFCRTLKSFDPEWNDKRMACMRKIVDLKFSQHAFLQRKLVAVKGPIVEENSWHDNFWGHCICDKCFERLGHHGGGKNNLGKILEEIRGLYLS